MPHAPLDASVRPGKCYGDAATVNDADSRNVSSEVEGAVTAFGSVPGELCVVWSLHMSLLV